MCTVDFSHEPCEGCSSGCISGVIPTSVSCCNVVVLCSIFLQKPLPGIPLLDCEDACDVQDQGTAWKSESKAWMPSSARLTSLQVL